MPEEAYWMYKSVRAVIGPKWSLEILDLLADAGTLNYTEIEDELSTSTDVVWKRLELLDRYGLVERSEHGSRDVRYSITDDGRAVLRLVIEIETRLGE